MNTQIRQSLRNCDVLDNIEGVEPVKSTLYTIRFSDNSSIDAYYSEGNTYILGRDYKCDNDIARNIGVLQINIIWNRIMAMRKAV